MDILKIIILVLLISFLVLSSVYKYSDCNKCTFEIKNISLNYNQFYNHYANSCFNNSIEVNLTWEE